MTELLKILPGENKYMNVTWQVNDWCNFRCSYCNEGNWGGNNPNKDTDKYIEFLDTLITKYQERGYESFKFFFSGGEPTYWKPLIPIANFLHEKCDKPLLAINTNLSNPLSWWLDNYYYFQDVVASYHIEYIKYDKYIKNAKFLQDKINYLALRIMMEESRFQECIDIGKKIYDEMDNCVVEWVPLLKDLSTSAEMWDYDEDWKNDFFKETDGYMRKWGKVNERRDFKPAYSLEVWDDGKIRPVNSNRLSAEKLTNFQGWTCYLNDAIFISPSGDVSAGSCGVSGVFSNINTWKEKDLNHIGNPVICPKNHCTCGTDVIIPKTKQNEEFKIINKEEINES